MTAFKSLTDAISDQFLACRLCLETYKKPKTLSCLHTFCTSCLERHLESEQEKSQYRYVIYSRSITCPICNQRTEVPSGGIRNLPDNFLVSNLTEVVNRSKPSSTNPVCDICSSYKKRSRDAVSKCLECSKFLCTNCVELHKKTKVTKWHNIFDVEVEKNIMCKCHEEEPVRFFCQPCETCVCVLCTFQGHMGHEVSSFNDGILKYAGNIQSMLKVGQSKMSTVQRHLDVMTKCEDTIAKVEKRVDEISTAFLNAVKNKQRQVIDEIRQFYGSEALEILDNKDELEQIMSNLKSTCGLAELILENRNVELLLLQKEVKEKMKSLVNVDLPDLPDSMEKDIDFVEGTLSFGFLNTGHKSQAPPSEALWRSSGQSSSVYGAFSNISLKDACTMTVRYTKDRGICTDPEIPKLEPIPAAVSDTIPEEHEPITVDLDFSDLKGYFSRRESLFESFRDDETFFEGDEREVTANERAQLGENVSNRTERVSTSCLQQDDGSENFDVRQNKEVTETLLSYAVSKLEESLGETDNQERQVQDGASGETTEGAPFSHKVEQRDASTLTEDIEIIQHYSELVLEGDSGQKFVSFEPREMNLETMAEFNVQRLSAGYLGPDFFARREGQEAPWQNIQTMNQLPVQTQDKSFNVPDIMECDSSHEIEFIDVMLRDSATLTDSLSMSDQQTMTDAEDNKQAVHERVMCQEADLQQNCIGSADQDFCLNGVGEVENVNASDQTVERANDTSTGEGVSIEGIADGFYEPTDIDEFTLLETDKAVTPDGTIIMTGTVLLTDSAVETEPDIKVETADKSCWRQISMLDDTVQAVPDTDETASDPIPVESRDFQTQTTVATTESHTMTDVRKLRDSAVMTEQLALVETGCETEHPSLTDTACETSTPALVDKASGTELTTRDSSCGDSNAAVSDANVGAAVEMVDSSCSPVIDVCDMGLQTEGWDFKDAYVDTDAIDKCDVFTEMPQIQLLDMFTNTLSTESVDESTSTEAAQLEDQACGTDIITMEMVGTITDMLMTSEIGIGTVPLETKDAASEVAPVSATKETMTSTITTKEASATARFRRKKPPRQSAGTATDPVECVDSSTATFIETASVGLGICPLTEEHGTETDAPICIDTGVTAMPILIDTGTYAYFPRVRDSSTDPMQPESTSVGTNTFIVSLAPRKRDASTTTARSVDEISQELEAVVLAGSPSVVSPGSPEPKTPAVDPELLGQKISELFSLAKLQDLTQRLALDRQRMAEQCMRRHVLPTAKMLEKRLSVEEPQPVVRRRLSSQKSIDLLEEADTEKGFVTEGAEGGVCASPPTEAQESPKRRPSIPTMLTLSKVSEDETQRAMLDITPAESSLEVTPGESPALTPSGDNLSSFSDFTEPVREKKKKHKKEKKKGKGKDLSEEAARVKSLSLRSVTSQDGAMATTPDDDGGGKKYKLIMKPFLKLGKFSKSMPTLARLDEKFDRFFRRSTSRDTTPSTSVTSTPKTSRAASPERLSHHRKARPAKVAALLEQTILEKAKASNSEGDYGLQEEDEADFERESNV